jgi:hypothetical protein
VNSFYYDRDGNPLTHEEFFELFKSFESDEAFERYRRIGDTWVGDFWISTVWLGMSAEAYSTGAPFVFESMVFGKEGVVIREPIRYASWESAKQGHEDLIKEFGK